MNALLAALVQAGALSASEAEQLGRMLDNDAARQWAEAQVAAALGRGLRGQRDRLVAAMEEQGAHLSDRALAGFWRAEERELARDVLPTLQGVARETALAAVVRGGGLDTWRAVNEGVINWVEDHYIGGDSSVYGSMRALNDTTRTQVGNLINAWQRGELEANTAEQGLPRLIAAMEETFGAERGSVIAVTEVTRVFAEAERSAALADENIAYLEWQTGNDELVCFPAGTRVSTPAGETPIEDIMPGQMVLTRLGARRVLATNRRPYAGAMVNLFTVRGTQLTCTANHPIWSEVKQGWLQAGDFQTGDVVQLVNNQTDSIERLLHFGIGNADDCPPKAAEALFLRHVPAGRMPICSVCLNRDHLVGDRKVNTVAPDPHFLHKLHTSRSEGVTNLDLQQRFALRTPVASKRTILPISIGGANAHALAAGFALDMVRRAAAFLRTVVPVQVLFGIEHLTAPLASNVFGFGQTAGTGANGVPVGNAGGDGKLLVADRAKLCDQFSLAVRFVTLFATEVPPLVKLRAIQRLAALNAAAWFRSAGSIIAGLRTILLARVRGICLERCTATDATPHLHSAPASDDLQRTTTLYRKSRDSAIQVYDIQVEGAPEFYANGILVHNCEICGPLNGTRIAKEEASFPGGYYPPAHPNCRCTATGISAWAATGEIG